MTIEITYAGGMQCTKWTDADFDSLSWHDCTIHSIGLDHDGEYQSDLLLDLDFILAWIKTDAAKFKFCVAPALLRFCNVANLEINMKLEFKEPMVIYEITRSAHNEAGYTNYHWTIWLQYYPNRQHRIELDATGFVQQLTGQACVIDEQSFSLAERLKMIQALAQLPLTILGKNPERNKATKPEHR